MSTATYDKIVESIYDSALNPQNWKETVALLSDAFSSTAAGLFVETAKHELQGFFFVGLDAEQVHIYGAHYAHSNPWFTVPGLMRPGRILTDRSLEILHNDRKAFLKTEMCQDWCRKLDFRHAMGGNLLDSNGNLLNFTFFRPQIAGYYTKTEIQRYTPLCRHLMKAVEMNVRLENVQLGLAASEHAVNQLRIGIILLDAHGRVAHTNDYARTLLKRDPTLTIQSSRLTAAPLKNRGLINKALEEAYKFKTTGTFTLSRLAGSPLAVSVVPSSEQRSFMGLPLLQVAVFVLDPDDRKIGDAEYLARRWNLTPLEARFCLHLMHNQTIAQIAEALNLTRNTARWYAKQILQKLGVKRQPDLILQLMNDLSTFLHHEKTVPDIVKQRP